MPTEETTYFALRATDGPEATGLMRRRRIPGVSHRLERIDRQGNWVRDNGLIDYFVGNDPDAEKVSTDEAQRIARRFFVVS